MGIFNNVKGLTPGRSVFDLSWEKKFTCDMGQLIPILHDNAVPNDVFDIGYECLIRSQPMAAPIMHPVYITGHYFFVPIRALCERAKRDWSSAFEWEAFITGDTLGDDTQTLPVWDNVQNGVGWLWDYLCYPIGIDAAGARPVAFKQWAYGWIWNEYYRDQNLEAATDFTGVETILTARWEKDYFTSCLPWQQRGTSPAIEGTLAGVLNPTWANPVTLDWPAAVGASTADMKYNSSTNVPFDAGTKSTLEGGVADDTELEAGEVDISAGTVTGMDIENLRLSISIQRFMELSARTGARYTEHLQAFFGVKPQDSRLQRPEYIGGFKDWLVTSEVLQTSETGVTPQGTMSGHGMSVGRGHIGKYRVREHGIIMGIFCIRPKTLYHEGIDRQDLQETRYDFYNPMFAGLAEQEVLERELYCSGVEANHLTVFGYQGKYDEYRYRPSRVCGDFHADYDMWHMCRQFGARPTLNTAFVACTPRDDWKAASAEDGFLVSFGNRLRVTRPMPFRANPGIGTL